MCTHTHTPLHEPFSTHVLKTALSSLLVTSSRSINPSEGELLIQVPGGAQKDKNLQPAASCTLNHSDEKCLM